MTFRAVVQNGRIVIDTRGELPDGTRVRVVRERRGRNKARRANRATRRKDTPLADLPAIGMWKNRRDWKGKSTLRIAQELRERALGGRRAR